jgi:hypothetical protein
MTSGTDLRCDGCGQVGSPAHIARRLRRLEWATRYRPVHIQTLLLGGAAPREDAEFLYAPGGESRGEAEALLRSVGIESGRPPFETEGRQKAVATTASPAGKTAEEIHAEFQAAGFFLTHILECPLEDKPEEGWLCAQGEQGNREISRFARNDGGVRDADATRLLRGHLPAVASRIRRSLKPKRVMLVTEMPQEVVQDILALDLGCTAILNDGKPFALTPPVSKEEIARFRAVLDSKATR